MGENAILAERLLHTLRERGVKLVTAESCTGGLVSAAITDLAGASDVFERGFVTYSNEAKMELLGVSAEALRLHGAVSAEVAHEMADGALRNSHAEFAISVTGIAGPGGGSAEKPVGLVWFGLAEKGKQTRTEKRIFLAGERAVVRRDSVRTALTLVLEAVAQRS